MAVVAATLAEVGDRARALALSERMTDVPKKAESLIQLIRSCDGTPDEARDLARRLVDDVRELQDAEKVETLGRCANALLDAGLEPEALELARLAVTAAAATRDTNREPAEGLAEAAKAFARARRFEEARDAAERISPTAPHSIVAWTMSRRARAMSLVAEALEAAGRHEEACSTVRAALDAARTALGDPHDVHTNAAAALNVVALAQSRLGQKDDAAMTAHDALELTVNALRRLGQGRPR